MGYFQDYREGYTMPESDEHNEMDAKGLDPNCVEDRELWRHCKACGKCDMCMELVNTQEDES